MSTFTSKTVRTQRLASGFVYDLVEFHVAYRQRHIFPLGPLSEPLRQNRTAKLVKQPRLLRSRELGELIMDDLKALDLRMERAGKPYYSVKYNAFMGVRSDWTDDSLSA